MYNTLFLWKENDLNGLRGVEEKHWMRRVLSRLFCHKVGDR